MNGRKKEKRTLERLYRSKKAEFVAIYGRRRVGKTFLVNECFKGRMTFHHSGLSPIEDDGEGKLRAQLDHFYHSLLTFGAKPDARPETWLDAFFQLELFLKELDDGSRQVVFIDELPWMDTPRSGFITALEAFWNTWGCSRNLLFIVCGSASSWILDKLVNNHGGLYNRLTHEMHLLPFTLSECRDLCSDAHIHLSDYDIVQSYMIFGGIPYYFGFFEKGNSVAQNVDALFFRQGAVLRDEYDRIFASVFSNPAVMKSIVKFLNGRSRGYTRAEISEGLSISDGGSLSKDLQALVASDFVIKYVPFGYNKRQAHYKLVDPFCQFYLHFVENKSQLDGDFWQQNIQSQSVVAWRGFAFENVCFSHIDQIKKALGISGIGSTESAWAAEDESGNGTQIDLLIQRNDNVINLCEIKFYGNDFAVTKEYDRVMRNRHEILAYAVPKKISIYNTLITTFGLKENAYSNTFTNVITMDDLFA